MCVCVCVCVYVYVSVHVCYVYVCACVCVLCEQMHLFARLSLCSLLSYICTVERKLVLEELVLC